MSDKEVNKEKVVTKYDRKMQRRKEEREKELRQKKINTVIGAVIVIALVAWIASFPIRTYLATHETFIIVNGESITQAEFEYNYYSAVNDYMNQYGAYAAYFGLDTTQDLSAQMYSDNLTWKDYFEEITVDHMKQTKALKAEADAAEYTYDAAEEIAQFKETLKEAAKSAGVSTGKYVKQVFGRYATVGRISGYIEEDARINAFYEEMSESLIASDEEIEAYYEENADEYDSVDYYIATYPAELSQNPDENAIAAAMDVARELAEAAEETIMTEGGMRVNDKKDDVSYFTADWLFDEARTEGDTTIIEDDSNYMYYVLGFIRRYLDDEPTATVRVIMTQEMDGQAILDEWTAGEATEESFIELTDKYSTDSSLIGESGLYEEVSAATVNSDMAAWIFAGSRNAGDVGYVTTEEGYTYVMYYVSQDNPVWKRNIKNILLDQTQQEYMDSISENVVVEDPKGRLNYLKVYAEEEAAEVSDGDAGDLEDDEWADDESAESSEEQ